MKKILTYDDLKDAIQADPLAHKIKDQALLFTAAMNDWTSIPTIEVFLKELKEFYGESLTKDNIKNKPFSYEKKHDLWRYEARASLVEMLDLSIPSERETDVDEMIKSIIAYYQK